MAFPKHTVQFKDQTRYRVVENEETQLDLAEELSTVHFNMQIWILKISIALYQLVQLVFSLFLVRLP